MPINLHGRSFLKLLDLTPAELRHLLQLAANLKQAKAAGTERPRLTGKTIALIFEKDSTRTRSGFEVAAFDQGAHVTYIGPSGSHIGHKETMKDTARVLGRFYDAIEYRGFAQKDAETLAAFSGVPVYNGLTDAFHPTQVLADLMTMREFTHKHLSDTAFCFMGDAGGNMAASLLVGAAMIGMDIRLCAPSECRPDPALLQECLTLAATTGARILVTSDPAVALPDCDFVYTDVWVSMGEPEAVWAERIALLTPYRVTLEVMAATGNPYARFMHCLPAFHNRDTEVGETTFQTYGIDCMEVTDVVFESPASIVFDQAENRMHSIKAILVATLETEMRIVIALGGNALLKRGEPMTPEAQRTNVRIAATAIADLARNHQIIVAHGNGPQVGLMALQAASFAPGTLWPLDVLGAETEGMIGYLIEQELMNALPAGADCATLLTRVEVDPLDPAFDQPTKPIGPVYSSEEAKLVGTAHHWSMVQEPKGGLLRVVPSPRPMAILNIAPIRLLVEAGICVVCVGGGGIPVIRKPDGGMDGVEAVIDKDHTAALLAEALNADALLMLTDVDAVFADWGGASQRALAEITPDQLDEMDFAKGSMGPKIAAACAFVRAGGTLAGIGRLQDARAIIEGSSGTRVRLIPEMAIATQDRLSGAGSKVQRL